MRYSTMFIGSFLVVLTFAIYAGIKTNKLSEESKIKESEKIEYVDKSYYQQELDSVAKAYYEFGVWCALAEYSKTNHYQNSIDSCMDKINNLKKYKTVTKDNGQ